MKRRMTSTAALGLGAVAALGWAGAAQAEPPADWSAIPTETVTLFYPGQSAYDWLRSPDHKRAFTKVTEGDACISCHEGEEKDMGDFIVSGERLSLPRSRARTAALI